MSRMLARRALFSTAGAALAACAAEQHAPAGDDAAHFFPSSYHQSRARFREACARHAADSMGAWPLPEASGPDLTIDHALFVGGGDRLLLIQSGVHGAEAATGAAVQMLALERFLEPLVLRGIDLCLIHAVNPWGFRHGRRTDAFNVNLNRNFPVPDNVYDMKNEAYACYRPLFEPNGPVRNFVTDALRIERDMLAGFVRDGFSVARLNIGLDRGQYDFPLGLNYGGRAPAAQTDFMREVVAPILRRPYRKVLVLDVHTGLGEERLVSMIKPIAPPASLMSEFELMLRGAPGVVLRAADAPGLYPTTGDIIDFLPTLAPDPARVLALTMEYGTLGGSIIAQLRSAARMILENQAYHFGCLSGAVCGEVRQEFLALFNPQSSIWRRQALRRAETVLNRISRNFQS